MRPRTKWELDTPALCLDAPTLDRNVKRMADFFADKPAGLRPHTKTHKSPIIAWKQIRAWAIGVTCAKLGEAEVMARAGVRDILIANQIVGSDKIARLMDLAAYSDVIVAVDHVANAETLGTAARARGLELRAIIEVDVGMGRCGTPPGQATLDLARAMVRLPGLHFEGIMGYEGHAVMIPEMDERRSAVRQAMGQLVATRDLLQKDGIEVAIVSGGGTGTYLITGVYEGITEIQAGSYATMDAKYRSVGIDFEQALTLVARVISVPTPDRAIIDAGMKALTKEFGFAPVVHPEGWRLVSLSEEHGRLEREGGEPLHPGDRVELVPTHGCTTINLHDTYHVTHGERFEGTWPIAARGKIR